MSNDAGIRLPALQPSVQASVWVQQPTKREPVAQACHVPPEGQVKFGIFSSSSEKGIEGFRWRWRGCPFRDAWRRVSGWRDKQ